jgi:pimeloyl-ACP methyl ester carboxylesterase
MKKNWKYLLEPANYYNTPQGRKIAYYQTSGEGIGVVFLGGFKSDMAGTKAVFLQDWARKNNRPFLRFDYSGHGESSEEFVNGCIGDWKQDAIEIISSLTQGPQILVGSSMGGWISLILCKEIPNKICGLVGIAAAPDFTEDSMWASFTKIQQDQIEKNGYLELPSEYDDGPYIITKKLIMDGRNQLVLKNPLKINFPCRFLQGTADQDVDISVALNLINHIKGSDIRLTLVKDVDHRFSNPSNLNLIIKTIHSVTKAAERIK